MADYTEPVARLLTFGDAREFIREWPDYATLGIGAEHSSELIAMATDSELQSAAPDSLKVWAPIHARWALGQLRSEEAIEPLLTVLHRLDKDGWDDWIGEELPKVYGMIGAAAIPALAAYLADSAHGLASQLCVAHGLVQIGERHPEARDASIAAIARQLERFRKNHPELNGFLVSYLIDLNATETAPLIQRAYATKCVDEWICGDWEEVQVELGLKDWVETEEAALDDDFLTEDDLIFSVTPQSSAKREKAKSKRKMARKSRKQNRKKKKKRKR